MASAAGACPERERSEARDKQDITDVAFTSAIVTVEQPPGTTVLTATCTFSSPTTDGTVSSKNVSCTIS